MPDSSFERWLTEAVADLASERSKNQELERLLALEKLKNERLITRIQIALEMIEAQRRA